MFSNINPSYKIIGTLIAGCFIGSVTTFYTLEETVTTHDKKTVKHLVEHPPEFEFYNLLENIEVQSDVIQKFSNKRIFTYSLQAGAFRNPTDAKRRAKKIKSFNLATSIKKANNNHKLWYRVIVGPFKRPRDQARARDLLLSKLGINSLPQKRPVYETP